VKKSAFSKAAEAYWWLEPDAKGSTRLHSAALQGELDAVPVRLLTEKNLAQVGKYGQSVFHAAVLNGHLNQISKIPESFLTADSLLTKDALGRLLLNDLISTGNFDVIPNNVLTEETLLQSDYRKVTVLHEIAGQGRAVIYRRIF